MKTDQRIVNWWMYNIIVCTKFLFYYKWNLRSKKNLLKPSKWMWYLLLLRFLFFYVVFILRNKFSQSQAGIWMETSFPKLIVITTWIKSLSHHGSSYTLLDNSRQFTADIYHLKNFTKKRRKAIEQAYESTNSNLCWCVSACTRLQ